MANETVSGGQSDSMFFSNWVGNSILDEMRPHSVTKPLMNYEGRRPSLVFNFPEQDDPGAGSTYCTWLPEPETAGSEIRNAKSVQDVAGETMVQRSRVKLVSLIPSASGALS